jgi:hypothetical protein
VVAPDYMDAMFNPALLLQRKGAYAEAAEYWRQYLATDRSSQNAQQKQQAMEIASKAILLRR